MWRQDASWTSAVRLANRTDDQCDLATVLGTPPEPTELVGALPGEDARSKGCGAIRGIEADPAGLKSDGVPVQGRARDRRATLILQPR